MEPFGFSLTVFVIGFGAVLLWAFTAWQGRRESDRTRPAGAPGAAEDRLAARRPDRPVQPEPDPDGRLLHDPAVPAARDRARRPRDGPQDAAGLDRHVPGLRGRVTAVGAASPSGRSCGPAWLLSMVAAVMLLATIKPELDNSSFAWSMAVLGVGMGLLASQLGNVVQSSVDASGRGEAGGLQFTGQQLGSSLGVALLGAIVLSGLTSAVRVQHLLRRADQQQRVRPGRRGGRIRDRLRVRRPDRRRRTGRRAWTSRPPRRSSTTTSPHSSRRSRPGSSQRPSWPCFPWPSPGNCPMRCPGRNRSPAETRTVGTGGGRKTTAD